MLLLRDNGYLCETRFRFALTSQERANLERKLGEVIHHQLDQVLFVNLGPAEGRGDRVISALGLPYASIDSPAYVF